MNIFFRSFTISQILRFLPLLLLIVLIVVLAKSLSLNAKNTQLDNTLLSGTNTITNSITNTIINLNPNPNPNPSPKSNPSAKSNPNPNLKPNSNANIYNFKNNAQQKLFHTLISELRCLVCQNQTLAESDTKIAHAMRHMIYERILRGDSKSVILNSIKKDYGNYILLNPIVDYKTAILWLSPFCFLGIGLVAFKRFIKR